MEDRRGTSAQVQREERQLPTINEVLSNPATHRLTVNTLRATLECDPVDAYHDVLLVAKLLKRRLDQMLGGER